MTDMPQPLPTYWHGRKWDAPLTDDAKEMPDELAQRLLTGTSVGTMCEEPLLYGEDIFVTPYIQEHIECHLRMGIGSVAHLEGRCICAGGTDEDPYTTYRESAKASMQWLLDHGRGKFHG